METRYQITKKFAAEATESGMAFALTRLAIQDVYIKQMDAEQTKEFLDNIMKNYRFAKASADSIVHDAWREVARSI